MSKEVLCISAPPEHISMLTEVQWKSKRGLSPCLQNTKIILQACNLHIMLLYVEKGFLSIMMIKVIILEDLLYSCQFPSLNSLFNIGRNLDILMLKHSLSRMSEKLCCGSMRPWCFHVQNKLHSDGGLTQFSKFNRWLLPMNLLKHI